LKPKTEETIGGLRVNWDCGLQADVVNYDSRQESSEVKLVYNNGNGPLLIGWQTLKYLSHNSQVDLERLLKKNLSSDVTDILDPRNAVLYLINTLEHFRKGETSVDTDTERPLKMLDYLLYPLIPRNKQTIIFGDGSAGKSTLALLIATLVGLPMKDNNLGLTPQDTPCKGLLLDWETDFDDVSRTIKRLSNWLGVSLSGIAHYRRCARPIVDDFTIINNIIEKQKIDFVIIDSLAGACSGDLMKPESATQFNEVVRRFNKTLLVIAHNPKDENNKTVFGSAIFTHRARAIWRCEAFEDAHNGTLDLKLTRTKFNLGPKLKELGLRATYYDDRMEFETIDSDVIREKHILGSISARITRLLTVKDYYYKDIAKELGITEGTAKTVLSNMTNEHKVNRLGDGKYGIG